MAKRPADEVENEAVVEEAPETGPSLETGLIITTTIVLLVAMVVGLMELGNSYGSGMLGG